MHLIIHMHARIYIYIYICMYIYVYIYIYIYAGVHVDYKISCEISGMPGEANGSNATIDQSLTHVSACGCQGYDSVESSVRKASVFCLVSLHMSAGADRLKPYLIDLNDSKVRYDSLEG